MRQKRMPTTIVLMVFSWITAVLGLIIGGYLIIFNFNKINLLLIGLSILGGGMLLAAAIRTVGNIGQILFDLKVLLQDKLETEEAIRKYLEQMNCDSKDINHNIFQIKDFFEQIERHLDLKK